MGHVDGWGNAFCRREQLVQSPSVGCAWHIWGQIRRPVWLEAVGMRPELARGGGHGKECVKCGTAKGFGWKTGSI